MPFPYHYLPGQTPVHTPPPCPPVARCRSGGLHRCPASARGNDPRTRVRAPGLVTEMDKIGDLGELKTGRFYTRAGGGPTAAGDGRSGHMAEVGPRITDRVVREELGGRVDTDSGVWRILVPVR